jgi:mono/diheme cytochrome c family protein
MPISRFAAAVLAACCATVTLIGCSRSNDSPEVAQLRRQGKVLYKRFACGSCHGKHREGKRTAPPLVDLARHWDEASLVSYISDPTAVTAANPRLRFLSEQYIADMPPPPGANEAEIATLAAYMLIEPE